MNQDIKYRKQVEDALHASRRYLQALFDNSLDAILVTNNEGHYIDANPAACAQFGYTHDELVQLNILDLTAEEFRQEGWAMREHCLAKGSNSGEYSARRKDGTVLQLEFRAVSNILPGIHVSSSRDITERKRVEEALLESESFRRMIVELEPECVKVVAPDFTLLDMNPAGLEMIEATAREQVVGQSVLNLIAPECREAFIEMHHRVCQGESIVMEFRIVGLKGSQRWMESHAAPLLDKESKVTAQLAITRDVTERRRAADRLKRSEHQLAEAQHSAHIGSWDWDTNSKTQNWSDELYRMYGLHPERIAPTYEAFLELVHPEDRKRMSEVVEHSTKTREPFDLYLRIVRPDGEERVIQSRGVSLYDPRGTPIGRYGTAQDVTEHWRAQDALRIAEQKYRHIFENASEGIFQSTPDGRYIAANPALASMYGFATPEELIRSRQDISRQTYVDPTCREEFKRQLLEQGAVRGFETQAFRKDGSKFWISVNARAVRDEQRAIQYYEGTVNDINERKRAEDQLRESEERYRELFENSKDATYVHDLEGRYTSVNRAAEKLSGHSREEILGRNFAEFVAPEHIKILREQLCRKLAAEGETSYETEVITKDGRRVAVEVSSHLILENGVPVGVQGTARDITERKLATVALETSESVLRELAGELARERERLVEAQTLAKLGSWHTDLSTMAVIWSDQTHHIFETDPEEFYPNHERFLQFVHPEDRAAVDRAFAESLARFSVDEIEHRVLMTDGRIKFLEERWQIVRDEQEQPVRAIGTCMDITERKRAEERIGELLAREQTARQTAEVMRDAAVALTQNLSLEAMLETLLVQLGKLVPYGSASVMLRESEMKFVIGALRGYEAFQDGALTRAITLDVNENALLRQICVTGKSVLIADTDEEPAWQKLPGTGHVRCWLGVPLIAFGKVSGLYSIDQFEPGVFTSEHVRMAETLAAQAASAIQNAQLFEQGKRYATELEQRIAERERAEEKLRISHEQLRALSARLQTAREEEGTRIAREIHDELGGALTGLKWDLEEIERVLSGAGNAGKVETLRQKIPPMTGLIESTLNTVRRISSELRPSVLDDLGLAAAIQWQAQLFQARTGIVCNCDCSLETAELSDKQSTALFRILQETLTNVLRHAQATRVDIKLNKKRGEIVLTVSDNGKGITEIDKSDQQSLGILGMRERAHLIGGDINLKGVEGKGTLVTVRAPISGQERVLKMTR